MAAVRSSGAYHGSSNTPSSSIRQGPSTTTTTTSALKSNCPNMFALPSFVHPFSPIQSVRCWGFFFRFNIVSNQHTCHAKYEPSLLSSEEKRREIDFSRSYRLTKTNLKSEIDFIDKKPPSSSSSTASVGRKRKSEHILFQLTLISKHKIETFSLLRQISLINIDVQPR